MSSTAPRCCNDFKVNAVAFVGTDTEERLSLHSSRSRGQESTDALVPGPASVSKIACCVYRCGFVCFSWYDRIVRAPKSDFSKCISVFYVKHCTYFRCPFEFRSSTLGFGKSSKYLTQILSDFKHQIDHCCLLWRVQHLGKFQRAVAGYEILKSSAEIFCRCYSSLNDRHVRS